MSNQIEDGLVRETRERIIREGAFPELSHLALMGVVVVLALPTVPHLLLAVWGLVIAAACAMRAYRRRRLITRDYTIHERRLTRATTTTLALTWGVGAGLFSRWLPFADLALVFMVVTGLVAGATSTFAADRRAFRYFLAGILVPLALGVLLGGPVTHSQFIALILTGVFGAVMSVAHQRGYASLAQQALTNVELTASEERAAQEHARLNALFASAPVATVVVDVDGRVRDANPRFRSLFGYTAEEAQGRSLNELIVPQPELNRARQLDETVRGGETVVIEVQRRRKDGQLVPVRASAARVEGGEAGLFVLYEDISEEIRARAALKEAKEGAERVAQMRSAFLANMSHEIRTPMNAVLGLAELLLDSDLTGEQRRSLNLIQSSGETLLTLLNDILDLSKIEADGMRLETVGFDLPRLVESTTNLLGMRAREHKIELVCDIPSSVPDQVRGDPTRLRQVLTNLVGNAVKFTHEGEVVVSARLVAEQDDRATVRFAVRDTGIGIPEAQRESIFQPFSQGDDSMTRAYGGTGLGLTIARRLVQMMGGTLELKSEVGRGSEFSFEIALAAEASPPAPLAGPGAVSLKGLRMLVVDDNQSNRSVVRGLLDAASVTVDQADSAEAGLSAMKRAAAGRAPYALAILDAQMPVQDGFQMAEQIRADPALKTTRLLMLTSAGQRGDAVRCRELGIHGYLTKPVSRADLLDIIRGVLGGPEGGPEAPPELVTRHRIAESRRHLQILLADDNEVNQEMAATMLRKRGHHVDVVGTGTQAVAKASRRHYDVVFMDIQMPEMNGLDATLAIRAMPSCADLPIVALTAHALAEERQRCMAAGMNAYVTKPFKAFELFAAAEEWGGHTPLPPVDLATFRHDMAEAGAGEAVDGIVESFLESAAVSTTLMERAVDGEQLPEVARLAHAFRSSAGQLGAHRLAETLKEMETTAKDGLLDRVRRTFGEFMAEAEAVVAYLRKESGK